MNKRIEKLKQGIHPEKFPLSVERLRLVTESYRQTEGEPVVVRRAKAMANVLDNCSIFIQDGELIVGNTAKDPMGFEAEYLQETWTEQELEGLKEGLDISDKDLNELRELNAYWKGKNRLNALIELVDEERLWPYLQTGVTFPVWKSRTTRAGGGVVTSGAFTTSSGLNVPDWKKFIYTGLNSIIEEAERELKTTVYLSTEACEKSYYLNAIIISLKAIVRFANRFSALATELASTEKDPVRKKELEKIAETCKQVPGNPARDFREAIQSFWFGLMTLGSARTCGIGRFDQYMYPFYRKDKAEGKITDAEVLELLECLRIKDMSIRTYEARSIREKFSGMAKWNNMIIGGQTVDGKDGTNELSYLILDAARETLLPHHTITVRVYEGTPDALMLKAIEVVKTGIGMPAFVGDKSYIEFLLSQGVPLDDARDYVIAGCLDTQLMGKSRTQVCTPIIVTLAFDIFMHNGVSPRTGKQVGPEVGNAESFKTFDELMTAWKQYFKYFLQMHTEHAILRLKAFSDVSPEPALSALFDDTVKLGKDIKERRMPFENMISSYPVGMINVADSLAAVKKLVFDDKKVTMKELKAALAANWQGKGYADMRKMFLAAPKYGNDDDYVDLIARDLYRFWADELAKIETPFGGKHQSSGISTSTHWPGGEYCGATPDGRYAGETLADGSMSAAQGKDTHGPISLIKSAAKIDQSRYQSTLFNVKFHPSALKTTEDMKKLADLIKTYVSMGGKHVQFNVVGKDTLVDAQKQPEKHRDLLVRVAGYSAYFVELSNKVQGEIIDRMEYQKGA